MSLEQEVTLILGGNRSRDYGWDHKLSQTEGAQRRRRFKPRRTHEKKGVSSLSKERGILIFTRKTSCRGENPGGGGNRGWMVCDETLSGERRRSVKLLGKRQTLNETKKD